MTTIEWTQRPGTKGETWNPVSGCSKVSAGCKHCYAERVFPRVYAPRAFTNVAMHPDRLERPLRWTSPRTVFVNSMSDLFHEQVPRSFILKVLAICASAPAHTFLILTKRQERMRSVVNETDPGLLIDALRWHIEDAETSPRPAGPAAYRAISNAVNGLPWPAPNVWLGVSVEDQATADERIPALLTTRAAIRFVSYEPALGPVDFSSFLRIQHEDEIGSAKPYDLAEVNGAEGHDPWCSPLDWIIVGGESGSKARPCNLAWLDSTIAQCKDAGVPVFVKQLGSSPMVKRARSPVEVYLALGKDRKGGDMSAWPSQLRVRRWPSV